MTLYQIRSQFFVAGLEANEAGRIVAAAPIVSYMKGWTAERMQTYSRGRGWNVVEVGADGEQPE